MKYSFFNYKTSILFIANESYIRKELTDGEFIITTLKTYGKLDIGYGLWMQVVDIKTLD